jgi:hypothetical protein
MPRVEVDHGLAKRLRGKSELIEPVLLDLPLPLDVVGEKVARDSNVSGI